MWYTPQDHAKLRPQFRIQHINGPKLNSLLGGVELDLVGLQCILNNIGASNRQFTVKEIDTKIDQVIFSDIDKPNETGTEQKVGRQFAHQ